MHLFDSTHDTVTKDKRKSIVFVKLRLTLTLKKYSVNFITDMSKSTEYDGNEYDDCSRGIA